MKDDMKLEMQAGSNIQLDHIKEIMKQNIPDLENKKDKIEEFTLQQVIDNQERVIKEQKEDIERLQAQLDREIHINRIMKKALEIYANTEPIEIMQQRWDEKPTTLGKTMLDIRKPAKDTLKEIEEME